MGLDNGIYIEKLEENEKEFFDIENLGDDICYWRKCWNVRALFMKHFKEDQDSCYYKLTPDILWQVIKDFEWLMKKKNWEVSESHLWGWKEIKKQLRHDYMMMRIIHQWMLRNPDKDVTFYDSY